MSGSRRLPTAFLLRLLVLLALTGAIGLAYQAVENFIPYWDYARVDKLFHALADAFDDGTVAGFSWLVEQVNNVEYNSMFALPLMVAADVIGASRDRIVLAVLMVHTALYLVAYGFLLRRVFGYRSLDEIGVLQLASALLLPSVFTATMLGFETIAVLPVLTVALTVFLGASWPDRPRGDGTRLAAFFLAGALLAATFLIRRAYAYTVISFYATAGLVLIGQVAMGQLEWRSREVLVRAGGLGIAGLGSLALLLGFARERVLSVLATPYHELYAAWKITSAEAGRQLLSSVGGIVLIAAVAGYLFRRFVVPPGRRVMAVLLGLTGTLGFLQWFFLVKLRMRLDKPMLYAPMIALGIALLFTGRDDRRWSNAARAACLVLLVVNLAVSLGALPEVAAARRVVFADPLPPLTRPDMDEYRDLIGWLRSETVDGDGLAEPILVLAATGDVNDSLVKEAEVRFFGWGNQILDIPPYNTVDRTSNYPVWLHRAEWVLVARPFQFHTSAKERRLLRFGWDEFVEGRGVSRNFERLDRVWRLGRRADKPVKVEVWRRIRSDSPAELLDLLDRSKAFVIHHPVFPDLWVEEDEIGGFRSVRIKRQGEHYALSFNLPGGRRNATSAVLMEPFDPGVAVRIDAVVARGDGRASELVAEFVDAATVGDGVEIVASREAVGFDGNGTARFAARTPEGGSTLLRLRLERTSGPPVAVRAAVEIVDHSR
jgi:hypothetical protein